MFFNPNSQDHVHETENFIILVYGYSKCKNALAEIFPGNSQIRQLSCSPLSINDIP